MNDRNRAIAIGVVAGALLGAAFAWVATSAYDEAEDGENPIAELGPGDFFQLAIAILSLARQFGGMIKRA